MGPVGHVDLEQSLALKRCFTNMCINDAHTHIQKEWRGVGPGYEETGDRARAKETGPSGASICVRTLQCHLTPG